MSGFRFVPVEQLEGSPPLIIGLSGMSDSGKTYSALLLAQGIARQRGGSVCAVDTEGRLKKYENAAAYPELHPFFAARWQPPFTGDRAIEACQAAVAANAGCIIIDSATDEWEGEGGVLSSQEEYLGRMAGDDSEKRNRMNMAAWAKAKTPHKRWHGFILGFQVPIILCHRARRKTILVKEGGKTKIVDAGIQPVCDDRLIYDMMFHLLMDEERRDGSYKVLKGGYKHERHVFPGGRIDAGAIDRLNALTTYGGGSAKAAQAQAQAPAPADEAEWTEGPDSKLTYSGDDPSSREASLALFRNIKKRIDDPSADSWPGTKAVWDANADLINALPDKGRDALYTAYRNALDLQAA